MFILVTGTLIWAFSDISFHIECIKSNTIFTWFTTHFFTNIHVCIYNICLPTHVVAKQHLSTTYLLQIYMYYITIYLPKHVVARQSVTLTTDNLTFIYMYIYIYQVLLLLFFNYYFQFLFAYKLIVLKSNNIIYYIFQYTCMPYPFTNACGC